MFPPFPVTLRHAAGVPSKTAHNFERYQANSIVSASTDVRWRPKFLQILLQTEGDVDKAANAAGILPATAYAARVDDDDFFQSWEEIRRAIEERRSDQIEKAFYERTVNGIQNNRFDKEGNLVEETKDYDTPAGVTLLKGYRPGKFRERVEHIGQKNDVTSVAELFRALADEQRAVTQRIAAEKAVSPPPATQEAALVVRAKTSDEEPPEDDGGGEAN